MLRRRLIVERLLRLKVLGRRRKLILGDKERFKERWKKNMIRIEKRKVERSKKKNMVDGVEIIEIEKEEKIVKRIKGEILNGIKEVLKKGKKNGSGNERKLEKLVGKEKLIEEGIMIGLDKIKILEGEIMDLEWSVLVEKVNGRNLEWIKIGKLLKGGEKLGGKKMKENLVKVEGLNEKVWKLWELIMEKLGLIVLSKDVDVKEGKMRGEEEVMEEKKDWKW